MIHTEVQGGIFQAARELASNPVLLSCEEGGVSGSGTGADLFCKATARSKTLECIGEQLDDRLCLKGGKESLQFLYTNVRDDVVDVIVTYKLRLPYAFGMDISFPVVQRCRMRIWNGAASGGSQGEEMVYITTMGEVYHKSLSCSHIKLDIKSVATAAIASARNDNGAKYYPCEKCGKAKGTETVYITGDGTRYHTSLNCGGLKRTVTKIGISRVGSRRPCSRCCQ